jgi:methylmalonyl-CoA mutase
MEEEGAMTKAPVDAGLASVTYSRWRAVAEASLRGAPFDSLVATTAEGLHIDPLYEPAAQSCRITHAHQGQAWAIAQRIDLPDPAAANRQASADLENGADALTLVFHGSPLARGFGLGADGEGAEADMLARALDAIALDQISIRIEAGAAAGRLAAAFSTLVIQRKLDPASVTIDLGLDPVGMLAATGIDVRDRVLGDFASPANPAFPLELAGSRLLADGRYYHEAGAGEAQELGFTLATAVEYLRHLESAGTPLELACDQIAFLLAADADEFLTLAKFRALRLLWAKIQSQCGLLPKPARVHAETSYRMMTRRDPWVNVMRCTVATFSAGLAGADSVTILPFTTALGLSDEAARRLARNTQLILIEEANLAKVSDPAQGSGSFEALTALLCDRAWIEFQRVERLGSMTAALRAGQVQTDIARVRERRQRAIASRQQPITGTSDFPNLHEAAIGVLRPAPQRPGGAPTQPGLGEACAPLPQQRDAEPFEALRDYADESAAQTGHHPQVFLAALGSASAHTARASFVKNFFEAGGLEVPLREGFDSAETAANAFARSGAALACICSSDALYSELAIAVAKRLKTAGAKHIYLAGRPKQLETVLLAAGVDTFIYRGCDVVSVLRTAQAVLGLRDRAA